MKGGLITCTTLENQMFLKSDSQSTLIEIHFKPTVFWMVTRMRPPPAQLELCYKMFYQYFRIVVVTTEIYEVN